MTGRVQMRTIGVDGRFMDVRPICHVAGDRPSTLVLATRYSCNWIMATMPKRTNLKQPVNMVSNLTRQAGCYV